MFCNAASAIGKCARGLSESSAGFGWTYISQEDEDEDDEQDDDDEVVVAKGRTSGKRVLQLHLKSGKVLRAFASVAEAGATLDLAHSGKR